ncbi:MAG: hypothetical protein WCG50_12965 [Rhodoferax sp.]|uniref:hypothetical protein n=1 Tax=Rhodoferax sp. TaxID=50421 RepID=UPI003015FD38
MISAHIEKSLASVELSFNEVSAALVSGEPLALETASVALRQATIDFSQLMQGLSANDRQDKALVLRMKKIAEGLPILKDGLYRRTALVEMALKAVVPATQDATYAKATGPYGSLGKQTGAFKFLAA